jgi:hypothetical protein
MRRMKWIALAALAALAPVTAAGAIGRGSGTEAVSATFGASSIGDPNDKTCAVTREGTYIKFTADYSGRLTTRSEDILDFTLSGGKILANLETGLGSAKGSWSLVEPDTRTTIGSGQFMAVFTGDPNQFGDPNAFGGELDGMMVGGVADPNVRTALWNFSASLSDGGRTLTGAIGDPTIAPNPAILFPPDPCKL